MYFFGMFGFIKHVHTMKSKLTRNIYDDRLRRILKMLCGPNRPPGVLIPVHENNVGNSQVKTTVQHVCIVIVVMKSQVLKGGLALIERVTGKEMQA